MADVYLKFILFWHRIFSQNSYILKLYYTQNFKSTLTNFQSISNNFAYILFFSISMMSTLFTSTKYYVHQKYFQNRLIHKNIYWRTILLCSLPKTKTSTTKTHKFFQKLKTRTTAYISFTFLFFLIFAL